MFKVVVYFNFRFYAKSKYYTTDTLVSQMSQLLSFLLRNTNYTCSMLFFKLPFFKLEEIDAAFNFFFTYVNLILLFYVLFGKKRTVHFNFNLTLNIRVHIPANFHLYSPGTVQI